MAVDVSVSLLKKFQASLEKLSSNFSSTAGPVNSLQSKESHDAVILDLGKPSFRGKLEKHLRDHYSGHGNLSKDMYGEIKEKALQTGSKLALNNPQALKMYAGYLTAGFEYGTKSRFVAGAEEAIRGEQRLSKSVHSAEHNMLIDSTDSKVSHFNKTTQDS